jgi:hypothetical protein
MGWSRSCMEWEERKVTDIFPVVSEATGTPRLVLQQLDENGVRTAGKVIVAEKLQAWRVDDHGRVVQVTHQRPLGDECFEHPGGVILDERFGDEAAICSTGARLLLVDHLGSQPGGGGQSRMRRPVDLSP